jgi:hypothetical protein
MTTNERLFAAGLLDGFDRAVADRDGAQVRQILRAVFVDEPSIELILRDHDLD